MERNEDLGDRKQVIQEGLTEKGTFRQSPEEGEEGGL